MPSLSATSFIVRRRSCGVRPGTAGELLGTAPMAVLYSKLLDLVKSLHVRQELARSQARSANLRRTQTPGFWCSHEIRSQSSRKHGTPCGTDHSTGSAPLARPHIPWPRSVDRPAEVPQQKRARLKEGRAAVPDGRPARSRSWIFRKAIIRTARRVSGPVARNGGQAKTQSTHLSGL